MSDDEDDAQTKFEAEREKILSDLPPTIKGKFGEIGFFLVENDEDDDDEDDDGKKASSTAEQAKAYYQPCLVVNPYEVPPKPVRDIYWMDMYTKAKRSKAKLAAMDYLVYVYGADDPDDCYNFVSQEEFVTLEDGQEQGLDQVPQNLQEISTELEAGSGTAKLTEVEQKLIRGLEEMKTDIGKDPKDRKPHAKFSFVERHEQANTQSSGPPSKKQKT